MAKWIRGQSGNPNGRAKRGHTITDVLKSKLDKETFVQKLIEFANGGPGIDPQVQLSAMKLILGYVDGLPIARAEIDGGEGVQITVTYVQQQQNNRIAVTGATFIAAADNPGSPPLLGPGVRTAMGQDGVSSRSFDSSSVKRASDRLV